MPALIFNALGNFFVNTPLDISSARSPFNLFVKNLKNFLGITKLVSELRKTTAIIQPHHFRVIACFIYIVQKYLKQIFVSGYSNNTPFRVTLKFYQPIIPLSLIANFSFNYPEILIAYRTAGVDIIRHKALMRGGDT